jgi:hypothetical protein
MDDTSAALTLNMGHHSRRSRACRVDGIAPVHGPLRPKLTHKYWLACARTHVMPPRRHNMSQLHVAILNCRLPGIQGSQSLGECL